MTVSEKKASLRIKYLRKRRGMREDNVSALSHAVQVRFMNLPEYVKASSIALYSSFDNEVRTDEILEDALVTGKEVYFPKADGRAKALCFFKVASRDDLRPGLYGIDEPDPSGLALPTALNALELIVVPGVVFDIAGARVGYGNGYYDRVLPSLHAQIVALGYDFQLSESLLPSQAHDVNAHVLVTESRELRF